MTKDKALQAFFESFGLSAYTASGVPRDTEFPWLTYEYSTSAFDEGETSITVNLWYHTESEAVPNAKAQEISNAIGQGGRTIRCDGGFIWLKRGSPFCQSLADEADRNIKRRYISITAEYCTAD